MHVLLLGSVRDVTEMQKTFKILWKYNAYPQNSADAVHVFQYLFHYVRLSSELFPTWHLAYLPDSCQRKCCHLGHISNAICHIQKLGISIFILRIFICMLNVPSLFVKSQQSFLKCLINKNVSLIFLPLGIVSVTWNIWFLQSYFTEKQLEHLLWNCSQVNATRSQHCQTTSHDLGQYWPIC